MRVVGESPSSSRASHSRTFSPQPVLPPTPASWGVAPSPTPSIAPTEALARAPNVDDALENAEEEPEVGALAIALERAPGTLLGIHLRSGQMRRAEVIHPLGIAGVMLRYEGRSPSWHDLGACGFTILEPPLHMVDQIRRTHGGGFEGMLPHPHARTVYTLTSIDLEAHFDESGESAWLDDLPSGGRFQHVPPGKKAGCTARTKPNCVPGSLAKGLAHAGDCEAAVVVTVLTDVIIEGEGYEGDRLKSAADVLNHSCHYYASKLEAACALDVDPTVVALLQLKSSDCTTRTHAVTIHDGLLFDSAEDEALPLTRDNLSRVLGAEYGGVVRGYILVPQPAKRATGSAPRICSACRVEKEAEAFTKAQRRKHSDARCMACVASVAGW